MTRPGLKAALWHRPMLENSYLPLLALLCEEGYGWNARERIINHVKGGGLLAELVDSEDLEPADLKDAEAALVEGEKWANDRRKRLQGVSLEPPELTALNRMLKRAPSVTR